MEQDIVKVIDPIWEDFKTEMEQHIGSTIAPEHEQMFKTMFMNGFIAGLNYVIDEVDSRSKKIVSLAKDYGSKAN